MGTKNPADGVGGASGSRLRFLDLERLRIARQRLRDGRSPLIDSIDALRRETKRARQLGPLSVVDGKPVVAPSGDPHDFVSIPSYHWPNPDTLDGLPWVFVDGKKNPQVRRFDSRKLFWLIANVEILTLSAWYLEDPSASERAALLLRTWFLDPKTCMNPHLAYAQLEPGRERGHSMGIIDFQRSYLLLDLVQLLRIQGDTITNQDLDGMRRWFSSLLNWLTTADAGSEECSRRNNHGTWYDVQVVAYSLFLGDLDGAANWLRSRTLPRMDCQITASGEQPLEAQRVTALQYCVFNLFGLCVLAEFGRHVNVDVWNHVGAGGQTIRSALDWLLPSLTGNGTIDGPITKTRGTFSVGAEATMTLRLAAERFADDRYEHALNQLTLKTTGCRSELLLPPMRTP